MNCWTALGGMQDRLVLFCPGMHLRFGVPASRDLRVADIELPGLSLLTDSLPRYGSFEDDMVVGWYFDGA